jgi:hypothetical protein
LIYFDELLYYKLDKVNVMKRKQESMIGQIEDIRGVPICGSNFSTPVTDNSHFISEIHYRIGNRLYIENAD